MDGDDGAAARAVLEHFDAAAKVISGVANDRQSQSCAVLACSMAWKPDFGFANTDDPRTAVADRERPASDRRFGRKLSMTRCCVAASSNAATLLLRRFVTIDSTEAGRPRRNGLPEAMRLDDY